MSTKGSGQVNATAVTDEQSRSVPKQGAVGLADKDSPPNHRLERPGESVPEGKHCNLEFG